MGSMRGGGGGYENLAWKRAHVWVSLPTPPGRVTQLFVVVGFPFALFSVSAHPWLLQVPGT